MKKQKSSMSESISEVSLAEEMPFWDFSQEAESPWVSLSDGTLVQGLKLEGASIETADTDALNNITLGTRAFLNSLPDGMELQFLLEVNSDFKKTVDDHTALSGGNALINWVSDSRTSALNSEVSNQELHKLNLFLFIYLKPELKQTNFLSFFQKKSAFDSVRREEHERRVKDLSQKVKSISDNLESIGVRSSVIDAKDSWAMVYKFLNPNRSKDHPSPARNSSYQNNETEMSPREQLVFSDLTQSQDSFLMDGLHNRIVTLKTLPEFTESSLISKFIEMPMHYFLSINIQVPDQARELANLQSKRRMAHSMSLSTGGRANDLESEARLHSSEDLLREIINTGQKIFYFQFAVLIQNKKLEQLDQMTKTVLSKIRELSGAEGLAETVANLKVFKTLLPFGATTLVRPKRIKTDNLADFLPIFGATEGHSKPVCIFHNRKSGLFKYDPFDNALPNYNSLVTGSSGAGKSFLNNCIMLQTLRQGVVTYCIDIGGSYRKLCEFMNGQYIDIVPSSSDSSTVKMNPFNLPDGQATPSPQKIKFLLSVLETMFVEDENTKLPKLDKSLLEQAIVETYAQTAGIPILSDLVSTLKKSEERKLQEYAKMLYPWTGQRAFGQLLDGSGTLSLTSDFVVFDLKGLSNYPDLQSVMILNITDFILSNVESIKDRKKQILMDECWSLLKSKSASSFMEYCARTLRKTGSGITFITQALEDILSSGIGPAILNNTATKIILNQRGDLEPARTVLKLNQKELALVSSLKQAKGKYSEAFLMAGDLRSLIRLRPTPIEYWLATSDASDNALMQKVRTENSEKTLPQIIHQLANEYPHGAQGYVNTNKEAA